jgi:nucleoside-triphosphatase THEP1
MSSCDSVSDRGGKAEPAPGPWREAAVLGGLWAAVEIAAGSFLHNLRVPFAGMLLAATGVVLLVAGHRRWGGRGLMWRAAAVCALVKSMSPSAVILGPMIGIAVEGFLVEGAVRIAGRRRAAYWIGGALAVLSSLVQKIVILIITYGWDIVRLYEEAYRYAARQFGFEGDGGLSVLIGLAVVAAAIGVGAAEAGYRVGGASRPRARPAAPPHPAVARSAAAFPAAAIARTLASLALVVAGFVLVAQTPLWLAASIVALVITLVTRTMPSVGRRVIRLRLWVELGVVMLASGWLLGAVRGDWSAGLRAGAAMVTRAAWMLVGFGVLGVALKDARLDAWLRGGRLRTLFETVDAAVSALPVFAAAVADRRSRWRQPRAALLEILRVADDLIGGQATRTAPRVVLLTGYRGAGKTTLLAELVATARARGYTVAGTLQHAVLRGGERCGYDVEDVGTARRTILCRVTLPEGLRAAAQVGRFAFSARGIAFGRRALRRALVADLIVVDEIGLAETAGGGWAPLLDLVMSAPRSAVICAVRHEVVDAVSARWCAGPPQVVDVRRADADRLLDDLAIDARLTSPSPSPTATSPSRQSARARRSPASAS